MNPSRIRAATSLLALSGFLFLGLTVPGKTSAQSLTITLLGTGGPDPLMERFGPSTLVEAGREKLLFDCGRGSMQRIQQLGVPWSDIQTLFLTHLHSDPIVGIPDLLLTGWLLGRHAPPGVLRESCIASSFVVLDSIFTFRATPRVHPLRRRGPLKGDTRHGDRARGVSGNN